MKRYNLVLELSARCAASCAVCARPRMEWPSVNRMSDAVLDSILNELESLSEDLIIDSVYLGGWGDPMTHERVFGVIEALRKNCIEVSVNVNGAFLSQSKMEQLISSSISGVYYSLNAVNSDDFDALMQEGLFEQSVSRLLELLERREELGRGFEVVVQVLNPWGSDMSNLSARLEKHLNEKVSIRVRDVENLSGMCRVPGVDFKANVAGKPCAYPYRQVAVGCDGDVFLCCAGAMINRRKADMMVGSVVENQLVDFLDCDSRRKVVELMESGKIASIKECRNCNTPLFL